MGRYKTATCWMDSLIRDLFSLQKITFLFQKFCSRSAPSLNKKSVYFKTMKTERIAFRMGLRSWLYFSKSWMDGRCSQCFKSLKRESNQNTTFLAPPAVPVWNKYLHLIFSDDLQGTERLESQMALMLLGALVPTGTLGIHSPKDKKGK